MSRSFYRISVDHGEGWRVYGSCISEKMKNVLVQRFLARGWGVKVERTSKA